MDSSDAHLGKSPDRSPLKPGTTISHYKIIRHIGSGGMGEVYLAEDSSLNRNVALKFLPESLLIDPDLQVRFDREAHALAQINHPNVAIIFEVDRYQGRPFFSMEYIEGRSLSEIIAEAPLPFEQAIKFAIQIGTGLAAIHEAGLVHRDIKPSNILVDAGGRLRILDFGLVRMTRKPGVTRSPMLMGTIGYMSPEQIRGENLTPASDLFSLGIILYQMITGHRPFEGAYEASIQYAIVNQDPAPLSSHRPDTPQELAPIVGGLLEKDVSRRYQSAADVIHDLQAVRSDQTVTAPHVALKSKTGRLRFWIALLVVVAVALVLWRVFLTPPGAVIEPPPKTLAVLPFKNLGPPGDDYFAEGMTDAVTTRLARVGGLRVICRRSTVLYKESDLSPKEIGDELGADYILSGTIHWDKATEPNQVRINTRLIRAADESYLWGDTYDRVFDRIFDLQSDIAERVTGVLKIAVSEADSRSIMAVPTTNLEAYDCFLRGNHYFNRSWDQSDILNATEMFQRAVDLDTGFALAYAMLARGHESMYWEYFDRSEDRCYLARRAVETALTLHPGLVEGRLARGYLFYHCDQDYARALNEFSLGLATHPNHADLIGAVAAILRRQGRLEESADNFVKALELDPRSHLKAFDVALTYGLMRRFDQTERYLEKTLTLAPDWPLPYIYKAWCHIFRSGDTAGAREALAQAAGRADVASSRYYWWLSRIIEPDLRAALENSRVGADTAGYLLHLARIHRLLGAAGEEYRYADSARTILEEKITRRPDDARFHSQLGLAYAGIRNREKALDHGRRAIELLPASRDAFDALFLVINLAETLVIFEEYDAAIDQLEHLLSIPGFVSPPYLKLDPLWKPLQTHPRFQKLLGQAA